MTMTLTDAADLIQSIRHEISKVVIGQTDVIDQTLLSLIAGGHVLIEGVPGLGKTLLVKALAKTFAGDNARIQFTPDLMPADVTGHMMFNSEKQKFSVRKGSVFTNILLADEINRAPAKTQSALLEVMQEQQVTIEGHTFPVPLPFMTLATQNPLEQEGTYPLPEAQLDRFLMKIYIDYPSFEEETQLVVNVTDKKIGGSLNIESITSVASPENIIALQQLAAQIQVDEEVTKYAVRIVHATRNWQGLNIGSGPRGSISLIRAARAVALQEGRDFVSPDDVKHIALPVLRHRVALAPEMELEGYNTDHILQNILVKTEAPRQ